MPELLSAIDIPTVVDTGLTISLAGALIATWRWIIGELRRDRDYWRTMALQNLGLAEKGVGLATKAGTEKASDG